MKYLIIGLGNPGEEYQHNRHNIGFMVLDEIAGEKKFEAGRYAKVCNVKNRGRSITLIKPQTYMNLSGKAVRYWMMEAKVPIERVLVITDDIALPLGKIRIRKKGSSGGHNGLQNIEETLGSIDYPRLRFGIGNDFQKGGQVDFVLTNFEIDEAPQVEKMIKKAKNAALDFSFLDVDSLMNRYNS